MKGITRITRRLMLVFLALVASSMMFLSSPAVAATITTLNQNNFETEVLESSKPVVVILASDALLEQNPNYLEETRVKAEKYFGDKYKIVTGKIEENGFAYSNVIAPRIYPPFPGVVGSKNGELTKGLYLSPNDPTQGFEYVKAELDKVS